MIDSRIYLDNNATTPLDQNVKKAIRESLDLWANPSSNNSNAIRAAEAIKMARGHLAEMFNVDSDQIIFTSGGTECNNWIIEAAIQKFHENKSGKPHIVTSNIEHPSINEPLKYREQLGQIDVTYVSVDPERGLVPIESVLDAINESTCLVTIMLANNETGVIQPVSEIFERIKMLKKEGVNPICHSDVAQIAGKMRIDMKELKADAITVVGHKFYGPRIGALVKGSKDVHISPLLLGGNQEMGWRSGTENTPMIVGLGEAARVFNENANIIEKTLRRNRDYFETKLKELFPVSHKVHFNGSPRLPNTCSVAFLEYPSHACDLLDNVKTFYASTGAACHKSECSPILKACGVPFQIASKTLRISFGRDTTIEQIDTVLDELRKLC